jgi:NAD(P)-dependent dehydrogenase (short-subunit alcohol dehydrogenase family)
MTISTKENIVDTEGQQGRRHALALLGGVVGVAITTPAGLAQPLASPQAPRRVFVTGSSDGLGLEAARQLIALGHHVILHGRNRKRADDAMAAAPGAVAVVVGDVSVIAETRALADQVNKIGPCDAVIHNVGISGRSGTELTPDGLPPIFAVNTLAPFTLTALIGKPRRLVYLSSSASRGVRLDPADLTLTNRGLDGWSAYGASKLQDILLAFAVARRWPDVLSNAMDPGWVPTRMGGAGAPDSVAEGAETAVWLAVSNDPAAKVSGRFLFHKREQAPNPEANDGALQDRLMAECERVSGVRFPK